MKPRRVNIVACFLPIAGRMPSSRDGGLDDIRSVVAAKSGLDVHWDQGFSADA